MSRPGKLTTNVIRDIESVLAIGSTYILAAHYVGISYDTFNAWRKRGEREEARLLADESAKPLKSEALYRKFYHAIPSAEATLATNALNVIYQRGVVEHDPVWASWILGKRFPDAYGQKSDLTVKGDPNAPLQIHTIRIIEPDEPGDDES